MRREVVVGPQVDVKQASRKPGPAPGSWLVVWDVRNTSEKPLEVLAGRLPHSQFRAEERELSPSPVIMAEKSALLEFAVSCDAAPGAVVENAFLILRVRWADEPWRILIRFRVVFDEERGPQTTTELVTTQRVGFSIAGSES